MIMRIRLYGKSHREGTSKRTGSPYNFNELHYLGKSYGVEGEAALTATVDGNQYPYASLIVGADYDVEFDNRGRVADLRRANSAPGAPGASK